VYVDSGSTDGSIAHAREQGVEVVELDASISFTAARARNAGAERIKELVGDTGLVMFVDGDCEVTSDWLPAAKAFLGQHPDYAVAAGRRRERFPDASAYNYLCDVEWNTPIGDADSCGGDAMMRMDAFTGVSGFDPSLIAGEEPELCIRLRATGWRIRRLDHEMTLHDANITRFSQWWTRAIRAGHAYAEVGAMHGEAKDTTKSLKTLVWAFVLPIASLGLGPFTGGWSLALLLLYPLNTARIAMRLRREGEPRPWTVGAFLMLSKLPEALGWLRYQAGRFTGRRSKLIEYKAAEQSDQ